MLDEYEAGRVVGIVDVMVGRQRRSDLVLRQETKLVVSL